MLSETFRQLQTGNDDLSIIAKMIEVAHDSTDLQDVLENAMDTALTLENVDIAGIYIIDEKKNEAVLKAYRNVPDKFLQKAARIPYSKGLTWKVIKSGKSVNIYDVQHDPDIGPAGKLLGLHSFLGIPIPMDDQIVGVIWLLSGKERKFSKKEVKLLESIGKQIAISIARAKMLEDMTKLINAIEQTEDMIFIADKDGIIEYVNPSFLRHTGYTKNEVIGKTPAILRSGSHDFKFYRELYNAIHSGRHFTAEFTNKRKNGDLFYESKTITPVTNSRGEITHYISTGKDITEQKDTENKLKQLINYDDLTGVLNRNSFVREVEQEIKEAGRKKRISALMMLDIDNFKIINDKHGYHIGDKVILKLSTILSEIVRENDLVARVGGDEFAFYLHESDDKRARLVAKRIIDTVNSSYFEIEGEIINFTVSIGIAIYPQSGSTLHDLFSCADLALLESIHKGGNCISVYADEEVLQTQIKSKRLWLTRVAEALDNNLFVFFAQPILGIRDKTISHYELLIRIKNKDGVIVEPGSFIDVSEQTGMIRSIDQWVIRNAINTLEELKRKGKNTRFSINISNQSFVDFELLELIKYQFLKTGVDPSCIHFEITETSTIDSIENAQFFISELKAMGCRFALDDFGKGFSSMYHLKHLKFDYLKIDGDFIRDLDQKPTDQHIVRCIVQLAGVFGMKLIAEHVQNESTLDLLRELGVDLVQGNHLCPPRPLSELFS